MVQILIMAELQRCNWNTQDKLMIQYHDKEWGTPVYDDRELFEHLCLDGFQAGLNWRTILHKRDAFRQAFANFDLNKLLDFNDQDISMLCSNKEIVRNRLKIEAVLNNARCLHKLLEKTNFSEFLWQFVGGKPMINQWKSIEEMPATSHESDAMSKALKSLGFKFVGSTICYAFMQAVGMVNDHTVNCFRHKELSKLS